MAGGARNRGGANAGASGGVANGGAAARGDGALRLPLVPLRHLVFFPHTQGILPVGRPRSVRAVEAAMLGGREVFLSAERPAAAGETQSKEPRAEDVCEVGTVARILTLARVSSRMIEVQVAGVHRARIAKFVGPGDYLCVEVVPLEEDLIAPVEIDAARALVARAKDVLEELERLRVLAHEYRDIDDPSELADRVANALRLAFADKQRLLEDTNPVTRLVAVHGEIEALVLRAKGPRGRGRRGDKALVPTAAEKAGGTGGPRDEIGDDANQDERDEFKSELEEIEAKVERKAMSREAKSRARKELRKLRLMAPMSAEATVVRNYLDWILALPWSEMTPDALDLAHAEKVLEEDHYGLTQVKERILEYLAVRSLVKGGKAPILCFVGPPGVGKTSLAKSIARATGKRFVRQSLGGVRDEAEVRGHRRTYIGALPGKILQSLKKAGANNPVFLLDEVDKMSSDFRGDPASALLEVLDPEQNCAFNDHYLDLDYDLSRVMFITTANSLAGIPAPLQDRMEIIRLPGYTDDEKLAIAERYLFKKQREQCGLADVDIEFAASAYRTIISNYTREAGVRNAEREIGAIMRKVAKQVVAKDAPKRFLVNGRAVQKYLGPPRYRVEKREARDQVGLATGLAWTEFGGELLAIEVTVMPGKGKLIVTGKLGDVMRESAQAAMSYVRSRAHVFDWTKDFYQHVDIHIHVPEGATPKDGPSAGITMATALVSSLAKIAVRHDVAMTGEITLRGRVLAIGGLKEKLVAANRAGIQTVVMPRENEKDIADVPRGVLKGIRVVCVDHMDEVLREALAIAGRPELLRLSAPQPDAPGAEAESAPH